MLASFYRESLWVSSTNRSRFLLRIALGFFYESLSVSSTNRSRFLLQEFFFTRTHTHSVTHTHKRPLKSGIGARHKAHSTAPATCPQLCFGCESQTRHRPQQPMTETVQAIASNMLLALLVCAQPVDNTAPPPLDTPLTSPTPGPDTQFPTSRCEQGHHPRRSSSRSAKKERLDA